MEIEEGSMIAKFLTDDNEVLNSVFVVGLDSSQPVLHIDGAAVDLDNNGTVKEGKYAGLVSVETTPAKSGVIPELKTALEKDRFDVNEDSVFWQLPYKWVRVRFDSSIFPAEPEIRFKATC